MGAIGRWLQAFDCEQTGCEARRGRLWRLGLPAEATANPLGKPGEDPDAGARLTAASCTGRMNRLKPSTVRCPAYSTPFLSLPARTRPRVSASAPAGAQAATEHSPALKSLIVGKPCHATPPRRRQRRERRAAPPNGADGCDLDRHSSRQRVGRGVDLGNDHCTHTPHSSRVSPCAAGPAVGCRRARARVRGACGRVWAAQADGPRRRRGAHADQRGRS